MSIYIICPTPDHNEQHLELHLSSSPLPSHAKAPECLYLALMQDKSLDICKEHLLNA